LPCGCALATTGSINAAATTIQRIRAIAPPLC
jgi:hypothetical protein